MSILHKFVQWKQPIFYVNRLKNKIIYLSSIIYNNFNMKLIQVWKMLCEKYYSIFYFEANK